MHTKPGHFLAVTSLLFIITLLLSSSLAAAPSASSPPLGLPRPSAHLSITPIWPRPTMRP